VRPGDQPLYISDTSKLELLTGWKPRRELKTILADIREFWSEAHQKDKPRQLVGLCSAALGEVA
jgi:UDP-glucose 4-epimerase